ncbi:MAG: DNA alkylation repair protein [Tepidiformaceae bacterium]
MTWASDALALIHARFEAARDPQRAAPMAAYMRDKFPFLGIAAPQQRVLLDEALAGTSRPSEGDLSELLGHLWELPEREYQYAGCGLVARHIKACGPGFLATVRTLVTTKSWWDTVDSLAKNGAGGLVLQHPELAASMDRWIESEDMWLRRTAILHQLGFKQRTDADRLFHYCEMRAPEQEFFIRKAIGWALREYSKVDADAVRSFVAEHESELSGLSKREALLWLNGGRGGKRRPHVV